MRDQLNQPSASVAPGAVADADLETAGSLLRWMILSRSLENRLRAMYQQSRLRGRLISGRGQEATAVGATLALADGDVVAPVHRDLGAHLVRGTAVVDILRHYLGRVTGPSRGRDGDIHMGEWPRGIFPMVSHLPDSWPIMVGVGLAFKLRSEKRVALAFCGDGATSVGAWHEAVNCAAVFETPTVFVIENNHYAYSTPASLQYRVAHLVERADAYGIPGRWVDGNDALAVHEATRSAVERARRGEGPTLIEADTFRVDGHAIHDDANYVPDALKAEWAARDPIELLCSRLLRSGWSQADVDGVWSRAADEVAGAVTQAESEPLPDPSELEVGVYAP